MGPAAVVVGWLVVAGSCFRSVPQIVRVLRAKSVEGLSLASFTIEALACAVSVAYNAYHRYPFSTYGDSVICLAQNFVIIGLIFVFGRGLRRRVQTGTAALLAAACAFLFSGACPSPQLTTLQMSTVAMLAGARIPQILLNLRRGNSGELSVMSTGLSVCGNAMRVFTTLALVRDPLILAGAASQLLLNGILLSQTIATARQRQAVAAGPTLAT